MSKVLILESDKIFARNLRICLERAGHKVCANVDAQAAIISADTERPDLVVLDLLLAGRSGAEFLYEFRSYPEWQSVPVYVVSTVPASEACIDANCFSELDIRQFFYKPATTLAEIVASIGQPALAAL